MDFKLKSPFAPAGDQPKAIATLLEQYKKGNARNTLLGVTGSGKTFTAAHVIATLNKPTLVISHNKTLVAQLYAELKGFFPENAVEYFVSYYDYYQPEAYVPQTDTFIEKDASINEDIDRLRLRATSSLLSRKDCIVVSSVSCIYGLGSPEDYKRLLVILNVGETIERDVVLGRLIAIHYERNDIDFKRGKFRVKGEALDVFLAYEETAIRIVFGLDQIERIQRVHPVSAQVMQELETIAIYPAKHFVTTEERVEESLVTIEQELDERLKQLRLEHKLLEAQRLEQRTRYDLEMLRALSYCSGIENYSRHLAKRDPGSRPYCLLDYFPDDFLLIVDESHVSVPQIRGMYNGDRARKLTLVDFGFRLPSALDNRPLKFEEFESLCKDTLYISATPSEYEMQTSHTVAQQIIRPTGLLDPTIEVLPTRGQVDHLIGEIEKRAKLKERVLVTTLTKRMSEDLCSYLKDLNIRVKYLHSEIDAIERVEILRDLRLNKFDCLIGINLLREGLDLPEVSLVAILDADKEGFLRSATALVQTAGRAARHVNGHVILYADKETDAIKHIVKLTTHRRRLQNEYNVEHQISPVGVQKEIRDGIEVIKKAREILVEATGLDEKAFERESIISELEVAMEKAARNLHFEEAIVLREKIHKLRQSNKIKTPKKRKASTKPTHE